MSTPQHEQGRDYLKLLQAFDSAIDVLAREGDQEQALRESFAAACEGFGASKALFLLAQNHPDRPLRHICVLGLTAGQVRACEAGESVPGISATMIRAALESAAPQIREHPLDAVDAARTASLAEGHYSAICGPVLDPVEGKTMAVLYFQNSDFGCAYRSAALAWLDTYTKAVGRIFGVLLNQKRRERELDELLTQAPGGAPDFVGASSDTLALKQVLHEHYIEAADNPRPLPVLIVGERGTGKEQVARYIHAYCGRRKKPFIVADCGQLTPDLTAARLFGHLRGAFTGADRDRPGYFQAAEGGVLFIDEVDELPLESQAALKRALDKFTVTPIGAQREEPFDVYVILATNQELPKLIAERRFKADLYDRFRVQTIALKPLRQRPHDIKPLLEYYLAECQRRARKPTLGFTDEVTRLLITYPWPGNVRELRHVCEALVTRARRGQRIDRELLGKVYADVLTTDPCVPTDASMWLGTLEAAENAFRKELILSRIELLGDAPAARESLGLTKSTFYRYLRNFSISLDRFRSAPDEAEDEVVAAARQ